MELGTRERLLTELQEKAAATSDALGAAVDAGVSTGALVAVGSALKGVHGHFPANAASDAATSEEIMDGFEVACKGWLNEFFEGCSSFVVIGGCLVG